MAEPTIQLGGGNWAGKTDNLLGYYKEGERFYKQEFTFNRSTTGTYTDKEGYIQEMPYNLLQQSNQFDTTWTTQDANVTSNEVGYDGSKDAWLFSWTSSTAFLYQSISLKASKNTISIYAKQGTSSNLRLDFVTAGFSKGASCTFDLSNGTAGSVVQYGSSTDFTAAIDSVGSGWYRISLSGTTTATTWYHELALTSGSVYFQNAQLVKGTSAKTYFPTTTRLNMPRVDYLNNSNGSLILEPQSTNTVTYSEDFSQWSQASAPTLTSGQLAPDGTLGATKISGTIGSSYIYLSSTTSTTATRSIYARTVSGTGTAKLMSHNSNTNNLFTLTEEWQRFKLTTANSSGGTNFYVDLRDSSQTLNEFVIWGAQSEALSYLTSYIPSNSGSSVTRNADSCSISNVADRIGQTEGTMFFEIDFANTSGIAGAWSISNGSTANRITMNTTNLSSTQFILSVAQNYNSGSTKLASANVSFSDKHKVAIKYSGTTLKLFVDGQLADSVSTDGFGNYTNFYVGGNQTGVGGDARNFIQADLYNTALTDQELIALTS